MAVKKQKTLEKLAAKQIMKDSDILKIANANSNLRELSYMCRCQLSRNEQKINYDEILKCSCDTKVESVIELKERKITKQMDNKQKHQQK